MFDTICLFVWRVIASKFHGAVLQLYSGHVHVFVRLICRCRSVWGVASGMMHCRESVNGVGPSSYVRTVDMSSGTSALTLERHSLGHIFSTTKKISVTVFHVHGWLGVRQSAQRLQRIQCFLLPALPHLCIGTDWQLAAAFCKQAWLLLRTEHREGCNH